MSRLRAGMTRVVTFLRLKSLNQLEYGGNTNRLVDITTLQADHSWQPRGKEQGFQIFFNPSRFLYLNAGMVPL